MEFYKTRPDQTLPHGRYTFEGEDDEGKPLKERVEIKELRVADPASEAQRGDRPTRICLLPHLRKIGQYRYD